ncbi:hypothetical protein G6F32_016357 [Rhizopus arrhizus]|nr:hypothetical protein G6F32_016357 [Rhizopus arrhizus]
MAGQYVQNPVRQARLGGQRRQRQPQAACHRGGTECDSHILLPMAAGVAARRSMHRLIASRSGVPRCP